VGRHSHDNSTFDLVFLNESLKVQHRSIKRFISSNMSSANLTANGSFVGNNVRLFRLANDHKHSYRCILDLIRAQPYLIKPQEVRPYALIAVADQLNNRVQVFRFYWMQNDVYEPALECMAVIGGNRREVVELKAPYSVAYSPIGELAIVDSMNSNTFTANYGNSRPTNMVHLISPYLKLMYSAVAPHFVRSVSVIEVQDAVHRAKNKLKELLISQEPPPGAGLPPIPGAVSAADSADGEKSARSGKPAIKVLATASSFLPPIHSAVRAISPEAPVSNHAHGQVQAHEHAHGHGFQIDETTTFEHKITSALAIAEHALDDDEYDDLPPSREKTPTSNKLSARATARAGHDSAAGVMAGLPAPIAAAHKDIIPISCWASYSSRGHLALCYNNGGILNVTGDRCYYGVIAVFFRGHDI
jgi:hypothetical protein